VKLKNEIMECSDEIIREAEKLWDHFIYTEKDSQYHIEILSKISELSEDLLADIKNLDFDDDEWR